jgi:hypothetical protein
MGKRQYSVSSLWEIRDIGVYIQILSSLRSVHSRLRDNMKEVMEHTLILNPLKLPTSLLETNTLLRN